MKHTLTKILAIACLALSSSAFAAGPFVQTQAPSGPAGAAQDGVSPQMQVMALLKSKLNLSGAAQEQAWANFVKGGQRGMDMSAFQDLANAKTTPELMNGFEKMQNQAAIGFAEQKKYIVGLYDVLNAEQRKTFDGYVFATLGRMAGGVGVPMAPPAAK